MQIHTTIDDQLLQQATHLTGVADQKMLLEEALRLLIQTKQSTLPVDKEKAQPSSPPVSKWTCLAQRVKDNPIDLGDYTDKLKQDMQACREDFAFKHDDV